MGIRGLGTKFLNETFESYGQVIKNVEVQWLSSPSYPGGKSRGLSDFWEYLDNNPNSTHLDAIKNSGLYQLLDPKGYNNIKYLEVSPKRTSVEFTLSN